MTTFVNVVTGEEYEAEDDNEMERMMELGMG